MNRKKEAIETMKAFASGSMNAEDFWEEFRVNETMRNIMIKDEEKWERVKKEKSGSTWHSTTLSTFKNLKDIRSYKDSAMLHWVVSKFISRNEPSVIIDGFYSDRYGFLIDIQPSWLDADNEEFLIKEIVNKIPDDLKSESQKIKWCKNKIKEYFKYDKTPPRWVQSPEWPVVDGKPLVFKGQSKEKIDDECVHFCFYDPDTKQETVVTQMY